MSVEQAVFALAGAVCIVGAVVAATHRDPRAAGGALMATLVSLAVLYAGLTAPAVAALVVIVALFATVPLAVHLTVPSAPVHTTRGPAVGAAAALLVAALLAVLGVAIALGEVPVNVSLRSSDGYDLATLRDIVAGRSVAAVAGSAILMLAALTAARGARRRRTGP